jgi:hypothetical protein
MAEQRATDHRESTRKARELPPPPRAAAPLAPRKGKSPLPIEVASAGMLVRPLRVRAPDVVFVKGLLEASEGLAGLFAERGGDLLLVAPLGRGPELDELLADLQRELGATLGPHAPHADEIAADQAEPALAAPGA